MLPDIDRQLIDNPTVSSVKNIMKNGSIIITGKEYVLGSWKCGKAKAFTHIPTNFIFLFKTNSIKNHLIKRGRKSIALKMFHINRFWKFFSKKFDITEPYKRRFS